MGMILVSFRHTALTESSTKVDFAQYKDQNNLKI